MESVQKKNALTQVRLDLRRHGLLRTAYLLAVKAINKLLLFRILRGISLRQVNPDYVDCPDGFTCGFLSEPQLRRFAKDPSNAFDNDFVDEALAKGDLCYAFLKDGDLAAYSWYSLQPTRIHPPELELHFDTRYVYMYKGMTHPAYRGQRLYAIGMSRALQCYQRLGRLGLLAYVESHNLDSLKGCLRVGYQVFGSVYLLRMLGRYAIFNAPGCSRFGFQLKEATLAAEAEQELLGGVGAQTAAPGASRP